MRIILASTSPRRRELIRQISEDFEALSADIDESVIEAEIECRGGYKNEYELASAAVRALSRAKAMAVFRQKGCPSDALVIGADTVVALKDEILGKPKDRGDAVRMLRAQSMEPQKVITGVTLVFSGKTGSGCSCCTAGSCETSCSGSVSCCAYPARLSDPENSVYIRTFTEESTVYFKPLDAQQEARIQAYCDTEEPYDKAGAYGIQLNGKTLVDRYEGDYYNIVGFPVERVRTEIEALLA